MCMFQKQNSNLSPPPTLSVIYLPKISLKRYAVEYWPGERFAPDLYLLMICLFARSPFSPLHFNLHIFTSGFIQLNSVCAFIIPFT